jgi:hypothetical protein
MELDLLIELEIWLVMLELNFGLTSLIINKTKKKFKKLKSI